MESFDLVVIGAGTAHHQAGPSPLWTSFHTAAHVLCAAAIQRKCSAVAPKSLMRCT